MYPARPRCKLTPTFLVASAHGIQLSSLVAFLGPVPFGTAQHRLHVACGSYARASNQVARRKVAHSTVEPTGTVVTRTWSHSLIAKECPTGSSQNRTSASGKAQLNTSRQRQPACRCARETITATLCQRESAKPLISRMVASNASGIAASKRQSPAWQVPLTVRAATGTPAAASLR